MAESIIYRNHVSYSTSAFFLLIVMNQKGYIWYMSMPEPLEKYSHTPFPPYVRITLKHWGSQSI